jgi:hypothetical protein
VILRDHKTSTYTNYSLPAMPPISLLTTVDELLDQVPSLLEHVLKNEIETRAVTSTCLDLEKQIEELKKDVVQERMKQQIVKDKLAMARGQAGHRFEHSKQHIGNLRVTLILPPWTESNLPGTSESTLSSRRTRVRSFFFMHYRRDH